MNLPLSTNRDSLIDFNNEEDSEEEKEDFGSEVDNHRMTSEVI